MMDDREKVVSELQSALEWCQPEDNPNGSIAVKIWAVRDAVELLKEPEAVAPYVTGNGESFETAKNWWYECGNCNKPIDSTDKFCRHCGRLVKWE